MEVTSVSDLAGTMTNATMLLREYGDVRGVLSLIVVRYQIEGTHFYPLAKTDPKLADVSYLGDEHRHQFGIEVKIQVFADDRELEFMQVKHTLIEEAHHGLDMKMGLVRFGAKSCEMIAKDIIDFLIRKYGKHRQYVCQVDEDGENAALVVSNPL